MFVLRIEIRQPNKTGGKASGVQVQCEEKGEECKAGSNLAPAKLGVGRGWRRDPKTENRTGHVRAQKRKWHMLPGVGRSCVFGSWEDKDGQRKGLATRSQDKDSGEGTKGLLGTQAEDKGSSSDLGQAVLESAVKSAQPLNGPTVRGQEGMGGILSYHSTPPPPIPQARS